MRLAELVFWSCLAVAAYAYGLYPAVIAFVARWRGSPEEESDPPADAVKCPAVTLIVLAHRQEPLIVKRLQNASSLDYPSNRLEILIGCDGEEDLTGFLARSFLERIDIVQCPANSGMAALLNACFKRASGEIVVVSDATTMMRSDTIRRLAGRFHDPAVGGVCGTVWLRDRAGRASAAPWSRFERGIRRCETRCGALPEIIPGMCAIRRRLFTPLPGDAIDADFELLFGVHQRGCHVVQDLSAVAIREPSKDIEERGSTRRRAEILRGLRFLRQRAVRPAAGISRGTVRWTRLTDTLFGLHKVLRQVGPAFLIAAFVSNACLTDDRFYLQTLLIHESIYVCALAGWVYSCTARRLRRAPALLRTML